MKRGKKGIVEKGMGEEGRKEVNGGKGVKGLMGKGYTKLIVWKNACELRKLVYEITKKFPTKEIRRVTQMRDSARSIKQNIQEGYKRSSIGDYIHHLSIAQGSLGELSGDVDDCLEDNLINNREYAVLNNLIVRTDYLLMRLIQSLTKKKLEVTA
ncbi:MAG: four helix bundle protein [candidate division WOR-3 bacterium]